jgi:DNA-binding IclR family transcriptional regulator
LALVDGSISAGPGWLRILKYLVTSPKTPTELAALDNKHLSDVSRMLKKLRANGFVSYTDSGSRNRYYAVTEEGYRFLRQITR